MKLRFTEDYDNIYEVTKGMAGHLEETDCSILPNQLRARIRELEAEVRYWRESIRKLGDPFNKRGDCALCGVELPETHKPDCPWVIANE